MKEKSDFSKDTQEQFEFLDEEITLDPDVEEFISKLAKEQDIAIDLLVNEWLRANIKLLKTLHPSYRE